MKPLLVLLYLLCSGYSKQIRDKSATLQYRNVRTEVPSLRFSAMRSGSQKSDKIVLNLTPDEQRQRETEQKQLDSTLELAKQQKENIQKQLVNAEKQKTEREEKEKLETEKQQKEQEEKQKQQQEEKERLDKEKQQKEQEEKQKQKEQEEKQKQQKEQEEKQKQEKQLQMEQQQKDKQIQTQTSSNSKQTPSQPQQIQLQLQPQSQQLQPQQAQPQPQQPQPQQAQPQQPKPQAQPQQPQPQQAQAQPQQPQAQSQTQEPSKSSSTDKTSSDGELVNLESLLAQQQQTSRGKQLVIGGGFVITLMTKPGRVQAASKLIHDNPNLNLQMLEAYTPDTVTSLDAVLGQKATRVETACAKSHGEAIRRIRDSTGPSDALFFVFEEDVVLPPNFEAKVKDYISAIPADTPWDILNLYLTPPMKGIDNISPHWVVPGGYWGMLAYVLTPASAARVYSCVYPIFAQVDEMIGCCSKPRSNGKSTKCQKPTTVTPAHVKSSISSFAIFPNLVSHNGGIKTSLGHDGVQDCAIDPSTPGCELVKAEQKPRF